MPATLAEVEQLVGQLSDADRARLRDQLLFGPKAAASAEEADQAVEEFRRELDRAAALPVSAMEVLYLDRETRSCTLSMLACGLAAIPELKPATR